MQWGFDFLLFMLLVWILDGLFGDYLVSILG